MDITASQTLLRNSLGDQSKQIYNQDALNAALVRAAAAYSQYMPVIRRMGTGSLGIAAAGAATALLVVGGPFAVGQTLTLDPFTPVSETVTVSAVAPSAAPDGSLALTALTIGATTNAHAAGAILAPSTPGIVLQSGQDTYALPYDFRAPDEESFDMATGRKWRYHATNSFYDASSEIANELSGQFFGQSTNYGPGTYGYPVGGGNINNNPNGLPNGPNGFGLPRAWRFVLTGAPQLVVQPVPQASATLDFWYYGCHTITSLPQGASEAVIAYATWAALTQRIGALGGVHDAKYGDQEDDYSKTIGALQAAAQASLARFDILVRQRPMAVTG